MIDISLICPRCGDNKFGGGTEPDGTRTRCCHGQTFEIAIDKLDREHHYRAKPCTFSWPDADDWKYETLAVRRETKDDPIFKAAYDAARRQMIATIKDSRPTSRRVYACTTPGAPQVVVVSEGFEHVPPTQLAAFIVAAIAPALDEFDGDQQPRRFPRRVNGGGDLLIELNTYDDANRLWVAINRLDPGKLVVALAAAGGWPA